MRCFCSSVPRISTVRGHSTICTVSMPAKAGLALASSSTDQADRDQIGTRPAIFRRGIEPVQAERRRLGDQFVRGVLVEIDPVGDRLDFLARKSLPPCRAARAAPRSANASSQLPRSGARDRRPRRFTGDSHSWPRQTPRRYRQLNASRQVHYPRSMPAGARRWTNAQRPVTTSTRHHYAQSKGRGAMDRRLF